MKKSFSKIIGGIMANTSTHGLAYYSAEFQTVEIDSAFYSGPLHPELPCIRMFNLV
jgi:uncharacterized protein YecE (DUF72 family)